MTFTSSHLSVIWGGGELASLAGALLSPSPVVQLISTGEPCVDVSGDLWGCRAILKVSSFNPAAMPLDLLKQSLESKAEIALVADRCPV